MNTRTTARRVALPVVALTLSGVLSACGEVSRGDAAAIVDGTQISQKQVQDATAQLRASSTFAKVTPNEVTQMLAYGVIAQPIAKKHGIGLSIDDIRRLGGEKVSGIGPDGLEVLRINQLLSAQTQDTSSAFVKDFTSAVKSAHVDVNPRYGVVNRGENGTQLMSDGWLPWLKADSLADKAAAGQQ